MQLIKLNETPGVATFLRKTSIEVEINQGQTKHLDKEIVTAKRHKSGAKKK